MEIPYFTRDGELTSEGQATREWFESQIAPAYDIEKRVTRDAGALNGLAGHVKYYALNVVMTKNLTPEQFFEDFRHTAALQAWHAVVALKESEKVTEQVDEQGGQISELTEALKEVRALLDEQKKEITSLKRRNTILEKKLKEDDDSTENDDPEADEDDAEKEAKGAESKADEDEAGEDDA